MGRAMRWIKRLLTGRKEIHAAAAADWHDAAVKETKRWSFVKQRKSGVDAGKRPSEPLAAALEPSSRVNPCRCGGDGEEVVVGAPEDKAAVVIQKAFRGYLARKALRALRSLVKLQALVRGYLVRRQAATTLHRLQALMRLQADSRALRSASYRKSMEQERIVTQDARMRTPPGHRRRLSDSTDSNYERSPRIVEMDTCHLRSRSSRMVSSRYTGDRSSARLATDLQTLPYSPVSVKQPPRLSTRRSHDHDPVRHVKTAQNTPRFGGHDAPYAHDSPAKSVDGVTPRTFWHRDLLASPRYMAGTASSAARLRCQSAPRQQRQPVESPRASLAQLAGPPRKSTCTRMHHGGLCFHCSDAARTGCSDLSDDAARDYYLDRMW